MARHSQAHHVHGTAHRTPPCCGCLLHRSEIGVESVHLHHYNGFNFWRNELFIECSNQPRVIEYWVEPSTDHFFSQPAR